MVEIVVVVPVLARPQRVEPLLASLAGARGAATYRPVFVLSAVDFAEREAVEASGADFLVTPWQAGPGDWARKINLAYRETSEPWIFTGADDLAFHPGWADQALECAATSGAGVVGTNDLGNASVVRGAHATHSLVSRAYADEFGTVEAPGRVLHEGYDHCFVDNELVQTAVARGKWVACPESVVEHLHPDWRKAPRDATYEKGQRKFAADRALYQRRSRLWVAARS